MTTITAACVVERADARLFHPKYRADIDGMRAMAVLAVIGFHAFPSSFPGGFVGVDVFFVISGFLISSIIFNSLDGGEFSFIAFYTKRALRIFPALLVVLACCFTVGWFTLFADEFRQLGKHILGGALFSSNFFLWDESGYFDTTAEVKPLLHLWSLGIEEQFYLAWPLIIWAIWMRRFSLLTAIVALWAISFTLNINLIKTDPSYTFYMPHTRMWELLSGALMAYWAQPAVDNIAYLPRIKRRLKAYFQRFPGREHLTRNAASATGAALLVTGFAVVRADDAFPGWWALLPVVGTALMIMAGPTSWLNRHALGHRWVVWIGLISFPLYLWHWPLLTFARIIEGQLPSKEIRIGLVVATGVLAWLTYRFIETPIRRKRITLSARTLYVTLIAMGAVGLSGFVSDGYKQRSNMQDSSEAFAQFVGPLWQFTNNPLCLSRYPFTGAGQRDRWFCMTNKDQAPTVLLYGNSYANHLYPGLSRNSAMAGNTFLSIANCAIGAADRTKPLLDEGLLPCLGVQAKEQEDFVSSLIERNPSLEYVIINGLSLKGDATYFASIEKRIDSLLVQNLKVIVFIPHLRFGIDIKECFSRFPGVKASPDCVIAAQARDSLIQQFQPLMDYVLARHSEVLFFDQNAALCNGTECSMSMEGMPIFRDQFQHYSEFASFKVAQVFSDWAKDHAPGLLKP